MEPAYPCVCCGYRTLSEPPGSHEICPVCGWEDDVHQLRWPYRAGGTNERSLFDAQRSVFPFVSSPDAGTQTRADVTGFEREPFWRRIDDRRDRFEPRGGSLAPWPADRTVLYWWRRRTARAWWEDVTPSALTYGDDGDSRVTEFVAAVRAVADATPPADPDNLSGMEIDFDHYLWRCRSIRQVTVSSSADPARQLTAYCLAEQAAPPHQVAAELEDVWLRDLRYQDWDAHLLKVTPTSVDLHVVTVNSQGGYYITASIITRWSGDPDAPADAAPVVRTWRSG
ncbi:hypothetical protein DDE19_16010 [Micromonospora ureilytica]|uniref:Cysteine-rich CPCC domain-containing protein n=1 Tax=Micromonospora ureilytica TaxID=709868 RepID=A0A3N9XU25_9ACTN|nr:CPCC family cysteine-rich protein [Micromonospora ureilytica]RQX16299.1 hypothetical protein DDE19_16010 [Micromonospora ureilytica]